MWRLICLLTFVVWSGIVWSGIVGSGPAPSLAQERREAERPSRRTVDLSGAISRALGGEPARDEVEATRTVVAAVVRSASIRRSRTNPPIQGDLLTDEYVRAAAASSMTIEPRLQAGAFLAGLGIALDDSNLLRRNPIVGPFCREVESESERAIRIRQVGRPTILGRRDLAQHFMVSTFLSSRLNRAAADLAGLGKEMADAQGGSGFSFADLAADRGGIAFATFVTAEPSRLMRFAESFRHRDFMPAIDGLPEGIGLAEFQRAYEGANSQRFDELSSEIAKRIGGLPGYRR